MGCEGPVNRYSKLVSIYGTHTFPIQFSYRPVSQIKRHAVVQTHGGVRIHYPPDSKNMINADKMIAFSIEGIDVSEHYAMQLYYNALGMETTATFTGYWGDIHFCKWVTMDAAEVSKQYFSVTGSFLII